MECLKCKRKMKLIAKDFSYNFKTKQRVKYSRKVYWCESEDIWINIEIPFGK